MLYLEEKTTGYLGIDESNHGRDPEIFVAVFSIREIDIIKSDNKISKIRNGKKGIQEILKERIFHYSQISKNDVKNLTNNQIKEIVFYHLIKSFSNEYNLNKVIIDGELGSTSQRTISDKLGLEILVEPKADQYFHIVNLADQVANNLYRNHATNSDYNLEQYKSSYVDIPRHAFNDFIR